VCALRFIGRYLIRIFIIRNNEDPLHYTVKAGHSEVARTLMLHGADPLAKGKNVRLELN
jgi:ankyrin repeat protein